MVAHDRDNLHKWYTERRRHYCPHSETYTGCDSLITALREGWELSSRMVIQETFWRSGRGVTVFHFQLRRQTEWMQMSIINTPYVHYLIEEYNLEPVVIEDVDWMEKRQTVR